MKAVHTNNVVLSLSSSFQVKFCENFTYEDNFNNTFFDKVLPHTTAVVTEFRAKVILFPERAKQNWTLLYKSQSSVSTLLSLSHAKNAKAAELPMPTTLSLE